MRDCQIIIDSFEYIALLDVNIYKCVNEHAKAAVLMRIHESKSEEYVRKLTTKCWVKIEAVGELRERKTLLSGIITDFSINKHNMDTTMWIEITSGTFLMDLKKHFRVFQNPSIIDKDIYELLVNGYENPYLYMEKAEEMEIGQVFIQYEETDWEFAKRLAGFSHRFLIPAAVARRTGYDVGLCNNCTRTLEEGTKVSYRCNKDKKETERDYKAGMELVIESREIFDLGDRINHQSKDFYIYKIESSYKGGECVHVYFLKTKQDFCAPYHKNDSITGCSFSGSVVNVQNDRVQVDIENDENRELAGKMWFPYSTVYSSPDGTGWYCMPEVGDSIRLYIPGEEKDAYVISSVHRETDKARKNPDYKSFKTKYGKELLFTPNTLIMTNNKGMTVELSDEEGIYIASDKDITIQADGNMTIASQDASLLIAAQDKLQVKQGGTSMTLSEDISFTGGEFRIQ